MTVDLIISTCQLCTYHPSLSILYPDENSFVICDTVTIPVTNIIRLVDAPVNLSKFDSDLEIISNITGQVCEFKFLIGRFIIWHKCNRLTFQNDAVGHY